MLSTQAPAAAASNIINLPPTTTTLTTPLVRDASPLIEFSPQIVHKIGEWTYYAGDPKDIMHLTQADRRVRGCVEDWRLRTFITEVKPGAVNFVAFQRLVIEGWRQRIR